MHKAVINQIKKRLHNLNDSSSFFEKIHAPSFQTNPITEGSFHNIISQSAKPLLAIDGGNNSIFVSSTLSVFFVRVSNTKEVFNIIVLIQLQDQKYHIEYIPFDRESEGFLESCKLIELVNANDSEFRGKVEPTTLIGAARRILERNLIAYSQNKDDDALILWDGSIESQLEFEKKIPIDAIGVSKTTSLATTTGIPIPFLLQRLKPQSDDAWYISDVMTNDDFQVCFAKLHPKAKFVFRIDIPQNQHPQKVIAQLAEHSKDAVFLGYPYPLIKADELARVSEEELSYIRNRFFASFDELTRGMLENMRTTQSAHSVLDTMKF